jgi:hypothetical protein
MIIQTREQALRVIVMVVGITLLALGGAILHIHKAEMGKPERIIFRVLESAVIVGGVVLLMAGALGMTQAKRYLKVASGMLMVVGGLLMSLPGVPGPGLLTVFGGLALLAGEYVWARKLLERFKGYGQQLVNAVSKKKPEGKCDEQQGK